MTAALETSAPLDPVLRRLPAAVWQALPSLAVAGVLSLGAGTAAAWLLGPSSPLMPLATALPTAPAMAWAIRSLHRSLFDTPTGAWLRGLGLASAALAGPAALAAWSVLSAAVADASRSVFFQTIGVAAALAAVVLAVLMVVALPVAQLRPDVRLRSVLAMAVLAVARRPLGPLAALAVPLAVGWLGVTWFGGLLALVAPVLILLLVAAAWPTARSAGVAMPPLTPDPRARLHDDRGEK